MPARLRMASGHSNTSIRAASYDTASSLTKSPSEEVEQKPSA